ncbi:hypothetical protein GS982_19820 [Rhodococcus hoagii]|nr:hypothetical protein [Prescottella equi]
MSTPEIYVATLADYTRNHVNAAWLELTPHDEPLDAQVAELRARSYCADPEELIIRDTQRIPGHRHPRVHAPRPGRQGRRTPPHTRRPLRALRALRTRRQ